MKSLKVLVAVAIVLAAATLLLLPLPAGTRLFILVVLAFSGVFVFVDSTGKGKTFAALTIAALVFYLLLCFQRGILLFAEASWAGVLLGTGMILLPTLGAWAMVREILFGARVQQLAQEMAAAGDLPEDTLPRSASGRVDRQAADDEFEKFRVTLEAAPGNWKNWFNISTLYNLAGDRKRARKSMRTAIALYRGKSDVNMDI